MLPGSQHWRTGPRTRARGFSLNEQPQLADIVEFYDDAGIRPAIEVWQSDASEQLDGSLRAACFAPAADGVTLHSLPRASPELEVAGLEVCEVDEGGRADYVALLLEAYELPAHLVALRRMFAREHATAG